MAIGYSMFKRHRKKTNQAEEGIDFRPKLVCERIGRERASECARGKTREGVGRGARAEGGKGEGKGTKKRERRRVPVIPQLIHYCIAHN